MFIVRVVRATRYLVLIPILGLAIAAASLFVFGGLGLVRFIIESITHAQAGGHVSILPIYGLLEFVHQFLIGTVLYLTALGLYQLFIHELPLPLWMKTESSEDLETNLIGVTVVVLAIEFLGVVFSEDSKNLLEYGAGIALPIAALALFLGLKLRYAPKHTESDKTEPKASQGD
jgi:uncharacterized membrane protein YqhA